MMLRVMNNDVHIVLFRFWLFGLVHYEGLPLASFCVIHPSVP
jgi:hypothetical protein